MRSQISTGLCSTQPARGMICSCSSWCLPTSSPARSKIMHRVLVVPWSIAATKSAMVRVLSVGSLVRASSLAHLCVPQTTGTGAARCPPGRLGEAVARPES